MRALIRGMDALIRRVGGVFEFSTHPDCILRLQIARARHPFSLADGMNVQRDDPLLLLHLWNERVPPFDPTGPDLAWATQAYRMFRTSLGEAARWLEGQPDRIGVRAVGGATILAFSGETGAGAKVLKRLGFELFPYHNPVGRFGEFWENLYTLALMWAYNPTSVRHRSLSRTRRTEMWMSARQFLARYGSHPAYQPDA